MQYAMYCENGHRIDFVNPETGEREARYVGDFYFTLQDADADGNPIPLAKFCPDCGAATMSKCRECGSFIRYKDSKPNYVPNYCTGCGTAFPWVKAALVELGRVTDEAAGLTDDEKDALKLAYPELTKNTSKSSGAVETFKSLYTKFSPTAWSIIRTVLVNFATDEAKQGLGSIFHLMK